ncbi:MAG: alpha-amylase [Myxococcales bacterium]|nr:alpha-amylase [Myxococcales bacterium]
MKDIKHIQRAASLIAALALLTIAGSCVDPVEPGTEPLTNNVTDWRDEVIYQVLIDRFADGDPSNNINVNTSDSSAYHGGDWKGLQDRLPYLEELGVTAIWISPVVKNVEEDAGFSSYHGYWTQDFTRPNPHFGDLIALREMVDAAHARGMKVILDIVTNHVGQAFYYDINKNGKPDEFFIGQGGRIIPLGQETEDSSDLVRVIEWDPDFDFDGIQAWTSLGPSGDAPIEFVNYPEINRVAPYPDVFASEFAYNRKGRVTVWTDPAVCGCPAWGCPWDNECRRLQETLGDFPGGLKDIDTRQPAVRDAMFEIFARWIQVADFDGFRIDTLKHVEHEFWEDFCPRIRQWTQANGKENFLMFGEAFDGDDNLLGSYTQGEGVDSLFYFSQYYSVFQSAMLGDGARTCEISRLHCRRFGCAEDPCGEGGPIDALYNGSPKEGGPVGADGEGLNSRQLVINFASNHDVGRLMYFMPEQWTETEKRRVLHLAMRYLMTMDGIPSLYYGVEQEFSGGNDPANRENMWLPDVFRTTELVDGAYQTVTRSYDSDGDGTNDTVWNPWDTGNPTFREIKRLIQIRKDNVALRRGDFTPIYATTGAGGSDDGVFAFERAHPEQRVVVVMNVGTTESQTSRDGQAMVVNFPPGTVLTDLLNPSNTWPVTADGCAAGAGQGCLNATIAFKSLQALTVVP